MAERVAGDYSLDAGQGTAAYCGISSKSGEGFPILQIPCLQSMVRRSGNRAPSVEAHRHAIDRVKVAFQRVQGTPGF